LEIKAPWTWATFEKAIRTDDFSDPFVSRLAWQVSIYMAATGLEAVIACLEDGKIKHFTIEIPPYSLEDIRKRVLSVEFMVETGVIPECNQRDFPCPFFPRVCTHAQDEVSFDPVLDGIVSVYMEEKAKEKAAKEAAERVREAIMDHLGERTGVTTDSYKVTASTTTRTNRDWKAMVKAGIDLRPYESVTESVTLRVTSRGDEQ
jgi:hypothetical protein